MVNTIYAGRVGFVTSLILTNPDGTPIDLNDGAGAAVVTLILKQAGSDTTVWSHACTVDDKTNGLAHYTSVTGDFATAGEYYSLVQMAYTTGSALRTENGPKYSVIENDESVVSVDELLQFLDIPTDAAKSSETVRVYIVEAETIVNLALPDVDSSTVPNFVKAKKTLVKLKAAKLYFMNSDEGLIDPNKRNAKIELWGKEYNESMTRLLSLLSNVSTGKGIARRVKDSSYTNPRSYLYGTDIRSG